jgi:tetratricopeptide (TPR) repeat protein
MDQFYYGLRLFSDSFDKYIEVLEKFMLEVDTNVYLNEVSLAQALLAFKDSFLTEDYRRLAADISIPDYYKVLIHTRAIKEFRNSCEPFLLYGVYHTQTRNYSAALQFLEGGEHCEMNKGQREYWRLHYAYALFMQGDYENALHHFKKLFKSLNAFNRHSAKYFSAKILIAQNRKDVAESFLKEVRDSREKTKYVELAGRVLM